LPETHEEAAVVEQGMADGIRMRIECSMTAKRLAFLRMIGRQSHWQGVL
jgi:hypothetical protein